MNRAPLQGFRYSDGLAKFEIIKPGTGGKKRWRTTVMVPNVAQARSAYFKFREECLPGEQDDRKKNQPYLFRAYTDEFWPFGRMNERTKADQTQVVTNLLVPQFGDTLLNQITLAQIEDFQNDLVSEGKSPYTVNARLRLLHKILERWFSECSPCWLSSSAT